MLIKRPDYDKLCEIAREINDEDVDLDRLEVWEKLNEVISNIKK